MTEAYFCDIWCVVEKAKALKDLYKCSPLKLHSLALQIVTNYALTEGMIKLSA